MSCHFAWLYWKYIGVCGMFCALAGLFKSEPTTCPKWPLEMGINEYPPCKLIWLWIYQPWKLIFKFYEHFIIKFHSYMILYYHDYRTSENSMFPHIPFEIWKLQQYCGSLCQDIILVWSASPGGQKVVSVCHNFGSSRVIRTNIVYK